MIKIILSDRPLSTQHIYGTMCRGRRAIVYMKKEGKALKEKYQLEAKNQYKGKVISIEQVQFELTLFFGDRRKRDVDNYNKIILDSLEGIVYKDDKQIKKLTIIKEYDKENPRIEIIINKLNR